MKALLSGCLLLMAVKYSFAQQATPQLKLAPFTPDTTIHFRSLSPLQALKLQPFGGNKLIPVPDNKTVLTLPQDNMFWFKPDSTFAYNMPIETAAGNSNMPNSYNVLSKEYLLQALRRNALNAIIR